MLVVVQVNGGRKYIRLLRGARQGKRIKHHHVAMLGRYDPRRFEQCRRLIAEWKPMPASLFVLRDLSEQGGRSQGRGYFKALQTRLWRSARKVGRG